MKKTCFAQKAELVPRLIFYNVKLHFHVISAYTMVTWFLVMMTRCWCVKLKWNSHQKALYSADTTLLHMQVVP